MAPRPLFVDSSTIPTASKAMDSIVMDLVTCVKRFRCPSKLDFSAKIEDPMILLNNDTNKPFIEQLRKLGELRTRLARIQTHDDEYLEAKHKAAGVAIGRALFRMKEYQLKAYERYAETHIY
ncbi:unnamed protein product [Rhizoctonia solani]|uniref:Uncharacterized protein n=1 Tax=Rhizoctonia solani TaxID=456999 RepID=A0A8H3B299_9AGAM|nr:unnamed protein product [Rhizoctonia solani]CAE6446179.1 unnamed protein product [Rhizoctonia solani]